MRSNINLHISRSNGRVGMYSFVFASRISLITVVFLFVSFFIQPLHLAYANEAAAEAEAAAEEESHADDVTLQEDVTDPAPSEEVVQEEPTNKSVEDQQIDDDGTSVELVENPVTQESGVVKEEDITAVKESSDTAVVSDGGDADLGTSSTSSPKSGVATTSAQDPVGSIDEDPDTASSTDGYSETESHSSSTSEVASTTDDVSGDVSGGEAGDIDETNATTSDETTSATEDSNSNDVGVTSDGSGSSADTDIEDSSVRDGDPETVPADTGANTSAGVPEKEVLNNVGYLVTEENYYQFSKQSCVSVGEGAFHCSTSEGNVVDSQAVVYSEIGPSGSPEIFIKAANGDVEQITDNNFEDSSPHFDPISQRITWQRLVQGRYQIIIYDLQTGKEKQLTFSRTNNMEPSVSETGVVWQSWDNNDWEIMFYDGTYTDQLTNNNTQDVAPVMEDEYIIWTVIGADSQFAQVYSLETKETVTITNHEGGSILNPRFVLVYDTKFDNGDVVTQRFDPETGFAEAIAAKPAEAPLEIPDTDSTGETRALIQNKSSSKQTVVVQLDAAGNDNGSSTPNINPDGEITLNLNNISSSSDQIASSTELEVDLESIEAMAPTTTQDFIELTEFDLILPPTKPTTTTNSLPINNASSTQE